MRSLVLTAGLPNMRFYSTVGNVMEGTGEPGPQQFLPALFAALYGTEPSDWEAEEDTRRDGLPEGSRWRATGRRGGPEAGFHFVARGVVGESTSYSESLTSYGLPGMRLSWDMEWYKSGYVYTFHHRSLTVSFEDEQAEALFRTVWEQVFGQPPVFGGDQSG